MRALTWRSGFGLGTSAREVNMLWAIWLGWGCAGAPEETDLTEDPDGDAITEARFVEDLRAALVDWYEIHGEDVAQSGGAVLEDAQAAVTEEQVLYVPDEQEDPFGYDLSTHTLYAHPDVVWPGSDIVWFGAYQNSDGALVEIVDFN